MNAPSLHALRPAAAALLAVGLLGLARLPLAQEKPAPTLAELTAEATRRTTAASPELDAAEALVGKLDLSPDKAAPTPPAVKALADAAAALKARPLPKLHGALGHFLEPKDQATSQKLAEDLQKALDAAKAPGEEKKKAFDAATAEKKAADEALASARAGNAPPDQVKAAEERVAKAEEALAKARTAHESAATEADAAKKALESLKSGIARAKKLLAKEGGSLYLAWKNCCAFGKKLAGLLTGPLEATRLPGLVKDAEKAKPVEVHSALARHLPEFRRLESFNRGLRETTGAIRLKDQPATVDPALVAKDLVDKDEPLDYGLCKAVHEAGGAVDGVVQGFPLLFDLLRTYAGGLATQAGPYVARLRRSFGLPAPEKELPPLPELDTLVPANDLLADLRRLDEEWPLTAVQLREVRGYGESVRKTYASFDALRTARVTLSLVAQTIEDLLIGDSEHFISEQVRLFYFTNVPRLLQSLNGRTFILNPEGREAVERARTLTAELLRSEQEAFGKLAEVATLKREAEIAREELRQKDRELNRARDAEAAAKAVQASVGKVKNAADADLQKKGAALAQKQQELMQAEQALAADPGNTGLASKVAALKGDVATAEAARQSADADAKLAAANLEVATAQATDATTNRTRVEGERDAIRARLDGAEGKADGIAPQLLAAQQKVAELRRTIATQAVLEAEAFGTAVDQTPIYLAPANGASNDPIHRVLMYGYGDSKTLFIRGRPEDVEKALEAIAGFDRPAPQARITLWTMQLNSREPTAINQRVAMINRELRHLRNNMAGVQEVLRASVNKEVNAIQQSIAGLTRGSILEMEPRLNRYFFYPREVRERLGFRLPYAPWWFAATTFLRVDADVRELADLVADVQSLNRKIRRAKAGSREEGDLKELRRQRDLLDEFAYSALLETRISLERATIWAGQLKGLADCLSPAGDTAAQEFAAKLKALDELGQETQARLDMARAESAKASSRPNAAEVDGKYEQGYGLSWTRRGEVGPEKNEGMLVGDLDRALAHLDGARQHLQAVARGLGPGVSPCAGEVLEGAAEPRRASAAAVRLALADVAHVTRWTIPDPVHCTTLGETMFVLSLGRRSLRLRVLRDFTRELIKLSQRRENGKGTDHDERDAIERRENAYKRFLEDSIEVLRALITPDGSGTQGGDSGIRRTAFPAMPRALFGALHTRGSRLNDDELTSNQHEVLTALITKGRSAAAREVKHLVRQVGLTAELFGREDRVEDGEALRYRDQYLPLIGWLTRSYVNSPADFREVAQFEPGKACAVPTSYRAYGAEALAVTFVHGKPERQQWYQADRAAWLMAVAEARANSLSLATPRVAAADEMVKRLMIVVEDDLDHYFVSETLSGLQRAIHDKPGLSTRLGDKIAGLFGQKSAPRVHFGLIERTSILATNRLVARVSPNANADVTLDGPEDFLLQAQQLAQIAQGVNTSFFAPKKVKNAATEGATAAGLARLTGAAASAGTLGPIGGIAALLALLDEQKKEDPGEVYAINSGNLFKVTPIFDPSGQALRFKFDYSATVRVQEPNGTTNPSIPRVERHTVNTEVQLSNLELREISRFGVNAQLGLPEKRTGGLPFVKNLPLLKDIPLVGYFTRQAAKGGVIQESVILGQTAIYPTVSDIVDLLIDVPARVDLGDAPPRYLVEKPPAKPAKK